MSGATPLLPPQMTTEALLDRLLVPRPNGSVGLERSAELIADWLRAHGAEVALQPFTATPLGFQLLWTAALLLMIASAAALLRRRYWAALALALCTPALVLAETEWLWSPVSGLVTLTEHNVIGTFPGRADGPLLILSAHYDTATHFGDHFDWHRWGWATGPALLVAVAAACSGLRLAQRGRHLPRSIAVAAELLAVLPFGAMAWCFAAGPLLRAPSPGALDNGGAVAILLQLADRLQGRPAGAATSVALVFLAAEEERALGSWHFAGGLSAARPTAVINLETVGGAGRLAYAPDEGFQFRRWPSAPHLVALVQAAASERLGEVILPNPLPAGVLTDGRSFLAHGIPTVTLLETSSDGFPRRLHSEHDSRERLSAPAIERTVDLLAAIVARADADPSVLGAR